MRFPHFIAFFKYLHWLIYVNGTKHNYFKNKTLCGKRIRKWDVATGLKSTQDFSREVFVLLKQINEYELLLLLRKREFLQEHFVSQE